MAKTAIQVTSPAAGDDGEAVPSPQQSTDAGASSEPPIPYDAGWYVAVVRCNCEVAIAQSIHSDFHYNSHWFDYWIPTHKEVVIDKRRKKPRTKERVLLSTFIFCHVSRRHLDDIRFRPDVYKMLTMPGLREIYRIRDKELDDYRRLVENLEHPVTTSSTPLKKGQRVRITKGQMAGLEAYIQRVSAKKAIIGNEIKYISGATIEIDRSYLEIIEDE